MKEQTAAVQRMQDYIEAHLEADITLAQLSAVSLFSTHPGIPNPAVLRSFWLKRADTFAGSGFTASAMQAKRKQWIVAEAAFDCGFGVGGRVITCLFGNFGCRPGEYLKDPVPIALFNPIRREKFGRTEKGCFWI